MRGSRRIHSFTTEELQMAGKAKCGCVHHAEDGIPCEHDLALLTKIEHEEEENWDKLFERFHSFADAR